MSQLSTTVGSAIAGLPSNFPLLPKASLSTLGTAEAFLEKSHLRKAAEAGIGLPSDMADRLIAVCNSDVVLSRLKFGKPAFWHACQSDSLKPFFLFILLSQTDPKFTQDKASNLLESLGREEMETAGYAIAEAMGYDVDDVLRPKPKTTEKNVPPGGENQSQTTTPPTTGSEFTKP